MSAARKLHFETDLIETFLELYPIVHYKLGMRYEDSLRCGQLTRKQVAILQLLRSEGGSKGRLPRKEIEQWLASWFEASSATITRSLYALARPPFSFVQIVQDANSGREKKVILTSKGKHFLTTMAEHGKKFLQPVLTRVPEEVIRNGLDFMQRSIAAMEEGGNHHVSLHDRRQGNK